MDKGKNVVVVSLDDYSWDILMKRKFYAFPRGTRDIKKYFAFYKKEPVSAVTHYAEVLDSREGGKEDVGIKYWLMCFPEKSPPYSIVHLKKIIKLKKPIKKDKGKIGVQGRRYTTFEKLMNAKTISGFSS